MEMTRQFLIKTKTLSGYSFTQLAQKTGLHKSHLYRIYHGVIRHPRDETTARISRLYSKVYLAHDAPTVLSASADENNQQDYKIAS